MGKLNARVCRSAKPAERPYTLGDGNGGHGLMLRVMPNGNKGWIQRLKLHGTAINVGLGGYPDVSLPAARDAAMANHAQVRAGVDPRRGRRPAAAGVQATGAQTPLAAFVDDVIRAKRGEWKDPERLESQWRASLAHVPSLLKMPVSEITPGAALAVLQPLARSKPSVAAKVRSRLGEAMDHAAIVGACTSNPFARLAKPLKVRKRTRGHHRALPYADAPAAVAKLVECDKPLTLALAFQILTAVRPNEAFGARRSEIDGNVWTIPTERMKTGRVHRVPLSPAALDLLRRAERHGSGEIVFRGHRGGALHPNRAMDAVRMVGLETTAHGFRSTFRDWCAETNQPREIAEAALAHTVKGVEGAYLRSDVFERRRKVMDDWGAFLLG